MGRPPIGKRAMTDVERQQRRRERLRMYLPAWRPWDDTKADYQETKTLNELEWWLENGDAEQVTKWLAHCLLMREDRDTVLDEVRKRMDEADAEVMAEAKAREAGD